MADAPEQDKRELVIAQARRYKAAVQRWDELSRTDPAGATELWKKVKAAEQSLFRALDALDASGET